MHKMTSSKALICAAVVSFGAYSPALAEDSGIDKNLGEYVTVLSENFGGTEYTQGTTRNMVCVTKASEIVKRFEEEGGSAIAIFQQPDFSLYKVVTVSKQNMLVQCNQNGSLVVAWRADKEMQDYVNAAGSIGISLREAEIHAQGGQPPPLVQPAQPVIINNSQNPPK